MIVETGTSMIKETVLYVIHPVIIVEVRYHLIV